MLQASGIHGIGVQDLPALHMLQRQSLADFSAIAGLSWVQFTPVCHLMSLLWRMALSMTESLPAANQAVDKVRQMGPSISLECSIVFAGGLGLCQGAGGSVEGLKAVLALRHVNSRSHTTTMSTHVVYADSSPRLAVQHGHLLLY